jgi:hypothetical protein
MSLKSKNETPQIDPEAGRGSSVISFSGMLPVIRSPDVDGQSFLNSLKAEFNI